MGFLKKSHLILIAPLRSKISKFVLRLKAVGTGHNENKHVQVSVDLPSTLLMSS